MGIGLGLGLDKAPTTTLPSGQRILTEGGDFITTEDGTAIKQE